MQPRIVVIDRHGLHGATSRATLSTYSECRIDVVDTVSAAVSDPGDLTILHAGRAPWRHLLAYHNVRPTLPDSKWLLLVPRRGEWLARRWAAPHGDRIATDRLDPRAVAAIARGELGLARRESPRVPLGLMVRLFGDDDGNGLRGRTVNVSGGGMLVATPAELPIGARRRVKLSVGDSAEPITLQARILRRDERATRPPAYGLCFERLLTGQPHAFERAVGVPLRLALAARRAYA